MRLLFCLFAVSFACASTAQASFISAKWRAVQTSAYERERSMERESKQAVFLMPWLNGEQR